MAVYTQTSINYEFVKVRWQEPYVSSAINRKFFGIFPKGVYSGFVITPVGVGSPRLINVGPGSVSGGLGTGMTGPGYVSGNYDESVGWSIAVHQSTQGHSSTVAIAPGMLEDYQLDCTGLDGQRVYVALDVQYSISATTASQIKLVNGAEIDANPSMVVLGHVDVPANPLDPIDSVDIGYNDTNYPRLTPLSTPQRAGLMPASVWSQITQDRLPWQDLVSADRDPFNNFVIQITPSQKVANNRRIFTYVQANISSKFPRSATGEYNGGAGNDQPTNLNLQTGVIGGAHQIPTNLSFTTPSVVGTPNSFQTGLVCLDPSDNIQVFYSSVHASEAVALEDDNFPIAGKKLFQVCLFLAKTDGSGTLLPLDTNDIFDRRPFLNLGGGAGGDANELLERYKDQLQDSVYNYVTPTVFSVDEDALIDGVASTGSFSIVNGTFDMAAAETLQTNQLLGTEVLAEGVDIPQVDVVVTYAATIDTAATYELSRDGGANFQTASFERVGATETFNSTHNFDESLETVVSAIAQTGAAPSTTESLTATNIKIAQKFTLTSTVVATQLQLLANKLGTPAGSLRLQIIKDSAGSPSSDLNDLLVSSTAVAITGLSAGDVTVTASIPRTILVAGDYHLVVATDGVYQASYSVGVSELRARTTAGGSLVAAKVYNGTVWSTVAGEKVCFVVNGNPLELVLKITASGSGGSVAGLAAYFDLSGEFSVEPLQREVVTVAGSSNPSSFTIQSFVPNEKLLSVVEVETGKIYVAPFFRVDGQDVIFPAGVFNSVQDITLVFKQEQKAVAVTTVVQQGGVAGEGSKNYISNPKFETDTSDWSLFNTTLTSKIPTGNIVAGAASITTFGTTASSPLEGLSSLRVESSGVLSAGQGFISDAFTIDREDQAKVLSFSLAYEKISGTVDFSGTSNNTWAVYIAEVNPLTPDTVVNWIQPAGVYNLVQGSGVGIASGTFQTSATGTAYRLAVVCITATSGAISMVFDDFQLGPQKVFAGAAISDWVSFTPTFNNISGFNISPNGLYRRVGDSIEVQVQFRKDGSAGVSGSEVQLNLPFPMNTGKTAGGVKESTFGVWGGLHVPTFGQYNSGTIFRGDVSGTFVTFLKPAGASPLLGTDFKAGAEFSLVFKYPAAGLSSNTVLSQDTDTRVVAFNVVSSAGTGTITASFGTSTAFIPSTVTSLKDSHSAWNASTGIYTVPVSGTYRISGGIKVEGTHAAGGQTYYYWLGLFKNASAPATQQITSNQTAATNPFQKEIPFSFEVACVAGDQLSIKVASSIPSPVYSAVSDGQVLSISRISGPATIAASETVAASYGHTAGQVIPGSTYTPVNFSQKNYDTHNMYVAGTGYTASTGVWTTNPQIVIPVSGKYSIKFSLLFTNDTNTQGRTRLSQINKNGSTVSQTENIISYTGTSPSSYYASSVVNAVDINCAAGDIITFIAYQNEAVNGSLGTFQRALYTGATLTFFQIVRVGN